MMSRQGNVSHVDDKKETIYYSRDYRHLNRTGVLYSVGLILVLVPIIAMYLLYYSDISYLIAEFAKEFLEKFTGQNVYIFESDYLPHFGSVYCVTTKGRMPDFTMSLIVLLISLIGILILSTTKIHMKPLAIFMNIGMYISAISAVFFLIFPDEFPYTVSNYSELYMKQQIILWLMVIVVYIVSISLIKGLYMFKFITFMALVGLMGVYGTFRYVLYLTIVVKCSYLFMATLYFTFGVLFDFMVMVAIYSIFMRRASKAYRIGQGGKLWKWS